MFMTDRHNSSENEAKSSKIGHQLQHDGGTCSANINEKWNIPTLFSSHTILLFAIEVMAYSARKDSTCIISITTQRGFNNCPDLSEHVNYNIFMYLEFLRGLFLIIFYLSILQVFCFLSIAYTVNI